MQDRIVNRNPLEPMKQAFGYFENGSGKITFESLKKVNEELGNVMTDDDLMDLIAEADRDGDG